MRTNETRTEELLALGMFGRRSRLSERIEMLLERGRDFSPRASRQRVAASAVALFACMIGGALAPRVVAFAQERPSFEVATIKPNKADRGITFEECHGTDTVHKGVGGLAAMAGVAVPEVPLGRCVATGATLKMLIQIAYDLRSIDLNKMISGGPNWLGSDKYDIEAKAGKPAAEAELKLMLQTLLADRFKLTLHRENREGSGYALVVAKSGSKLKQATGDEDRPGIWRVSPGPLTGRNASISQLARNLSLDLGLPVVDETGLAGAYNFTLTWAPGENESRGALTMLPPDVAAQLPLQRGDPNGPSIFTAVQEQLGLKLEARKTPVEVLVIDHVEKPDAN